MNRLGETNSEVQYLESRAARQETRRLNEQRSELSRLFKAVGAQRGIVSVNLLKNCKIPYIGLRGLQEVCGWDGRRQE